jgi:hypothetical protein
MKLWKFATALALGTVLAAGPILADDTKKAAEKPPMDEKAAMEMMAKYATPGPAHKKLEAFAGTWTAKNSMWMDPSKPPTTSEGTAEQKWVLGGRFLEQRFEGTMMGAPFSGLGYTGYDNYRKVYTSTWMDTMGTMTLNMTGRFDKAGKVMTCTGKMDDFMTGKTVTYTTKAILVNADEIVWEMWNPGMDGKVYKSVEVHYTRKK